MTTKTIEEQKAILSYLLNNPEMHIEVTLDPMSFNSGNDLVDTRIIYEAFTDLISKRVMPDPVLLSKETGLNKSHIEKFYSVEYVPKNVPEYLKSIRNETIRNELLKLGFSIQELSRTLEEPTSAPIEIQTMINRINFDGDVDLVETSLGAILDRTVAKSEMEKDLPLSERLIESPYDEFNRRFGGFFYGDCTGIGATTSGGKTVMASDIITHALDNNIKVASVILEMSEEQLVQRQISRYSSLDMIQIRKGEFHHIPSQKQDYENAVRRMGKHRDLWNIYGTDNNKLERVLAIGRKAALNGVKLFTVDYLQLIQYDKYSRDRALAIGMASQALAALAKSTNMHVLIVLQLNRKIADRQDKRPVITDLKESSYIEQSLDNLFLLYRDGMYDNDSEQPNLVEVNVAKGRNIGVGIFNLHWDESGPTFRNLT